MAYTNADAETAARHVRDGAERIADLERSIERARSLGHPTLLAERALATMQTTLKLMLDHQAVIETALAQRRG